MIIISAIASYSLQQVEVLVTSLNNVGYSGDKIMVAYDIDKQVVDYLIENNWRVFPLNLEMLVHIQRYRDIASILNTFNEDERVIFIDGKDVFFYKNPQEWNLNHELYLGIDGNRTLNNHQWGKENFIKSFPEHLNEVVDKPHLNCGVIIGSNKIVSSLLTDIFNTALTSKQRIGLNSFDFSPDDQMALNLLAYTKYKDTVYIQKPEDRYIINLAQTKWNGEEYFLYHQYDRIKNFKTMLKSC